MLDDRPYMREPDYRRQWSATTILIVALVVVFLVQVSLVVYGRINVSRHLALSVEGMKNHEYWQLLTFQFLHATPWPWHLLFNCAALYFFGNALEEKLGAARLLKLYFVAGTFGGLLQVAYSLLPVGAGGGVVGASAGVSGLIAAFATLFPFQEACFVFYFFPVKIKAKYVLIFLLAISVFGMIFPFDNVAHAAHLGGLLIGIAYARWFHESNRFAEIWQRLIPRRRSSGPVIKVRFPKNSSWENEAERRKADPTDTEFMRKEVDPILEKISAHGIQSLTEREKKILDAARARMGNR